MTASTQKIPKAQRTNEREKPLIPQRIFVFMMVPGGESNPMELLPTDFEFPENTVCL
jgi:hypothetical protein